MRRVLFLAFGLIASAAASTVSYAQSFNNEWAEFVKDTTRLKTGAGADLTEVITDPEEKDYAWGDVNNDGWIDLIVVRKQPQTFAGKKRGYLLMNENGVLVDRTTEYASQSVVDGVPGDQGLLTPANNRDVVLTDINQDGWLDFVTATTISDGDPKYLSHPRVFINKGMVGGVWQGFVFEDNRFPQLKTIPGNLSVSPRFCAVAAGDVTGDGYPDLYFVDYDSGETGPPEQAANDLNDRLMINDGNGFFTDSLQTRMSATMLSSFFGMSGKIVDLNGDGLKDIVKDTALGAPQYVSVAYNNPSSVGFFSVFQSNFHVFSPYHVDVGDLNNDNKPDLVVSDDAADRYRYNTGNDSLGRVIWGAAKTFTFLSGADDGFAGNNLMSDLDNDGFLDILIADVDVDVAGCSRRLHIYHNPGGAVGSQITLREEAQQSGTGGWKGVKGMIAGDMNGTFDIAVFDIDNDGWKDIVVGRCSGTTVWMNKTAPHVTGVTSNTANGSYGLGQNIDISVTFTKNVTVVGTPTIQLETGAVDHFATYVSGSGTSTLVFNYTTQAGDVTGDLDYVAANALSTSGGSIKDSANHDAVLSLPAPGSTGSLGANKSIIIDALAPSVLSVTSNTANGTYSVGQVIDVLVQMSENVTVTGSPTLTLETGSTDRVANYVSGSGSSTLQFNYTVQAGDVSADLDYVNGSALQANGTIRDGLNNDASLVLAAPGNAGSLGANKDIVIDADGLDAFGTGTPGCSGLNVLSANSIPTVGNAAFGFTCTNAPPNSIGTLVISPTANMAGSDPFGLNVIFYVTLGLYNRVLISSDANGNCQIPYPLKTGVDSVGSSFTVQAFWFWKNTCPTAPISSSNGLTVTILPN